MVTQTLRDGLTLYKLCFKKILPFLCIAATCVLSADLFTQYFNENSGFFFILLVGFGIAVAATYVTTLSFNIINDTDDNVTTERLFERTNSKFLWLCLASIVYGLFGVIGFILLVVPGLYWMTTKSLYDAALIVDNKHHYSDAIHESESLVAGHFWQVFAITFVYLTPVACSELAPLGVSNNFISQETLRTLALLGNVFFAIFWTPLFMCVRIRLYKNLKTQKRTKNLQEFDHA